LKRLSPIEAPIGTLYERLYCACGEAENRIGEQFEHRADRARSAAISANQLRLWFTAIACILINAMRRIAYETPSLPMSRSQPSASSYSSSAPGVQQRAPYSVGHRIKLSEPAGVRDSLSRPQADVQLCLKPQAHKANRSRTNDARPPVPFPITLHFETRFTRTTNWFCRGPPVQHPQ
jgi:hypothetical protein